MTALAQILLVEDSADDVELTRLALEEAQFDTALSVAPDGERAMRFLRRADPYGSAPRPDLILLDLNLRGRDGCEVLREMKADPALRQIPVLMLTTSADRRDVTRAYDAHVNAYIQKPVGFLALVDIARRIEDFWFDTVRLPSDPADGG